MSDRIASAQGCEARQRDRVQHEVLKDPITVKPFSNMSCFVEEKKQYSTIFASL